MQRAIVARLTAVALLVGALGLVAPMASRGDTGTGQLALSQHFVDFGQVRIGTLTDPVLVTATNTGTGPLTISNVSFLVADPNDEIRIATDCITIDDSTPVATIVPTVLNPGDQCGVELTYLPTKVLGAPFPFPPPLHPPLAIVNLSNDGAAGGGGIEVSGSGTDGFYIAEANGTVEPWGDAVPFGSAANLHLTAPLVGIATTPDGDGYWLLGQDGGVFAYGDADFHGSTGGMHLNQPVVGIAATPTGEGYWLVAADGGIFAFGDAAFHGSMGGTHLNKPIVGMAATPSGDGYWLVASDGGIFAFGDAAFHGSMGGTHLNQPITGMASTPSANGYWLLASDAGVFTFGDAPFLGSGIGQPNSFGNVAVGIAPTPDGQGYWISDALPEHFGDAAALASVGQVFGGRHVVGIAPTVWRLPAEVF